MHRSVLMLAAIAIVMAGCDSTPSAPALSSDQALLEKDGKPAHQNTRTPFTRTVMNPCPPVPEPVLVEGYSHYNAHFKFFEGGNQPRLKTNNHASGVGLVTGLKYQFHELYRVDGTYTYANATLTTDQTHRYHVISQTAHDNFFSTVKTKVVCDAAGCRAEVVSMETDCRG